MDANQALLTTTLSSTNTQPKTAGTQTTAEKEVNFMKPKQAPVAIRRRYLRFVTPA